MQLMTQDGPYCLLYAAAMILDITPQELFAEIGYDGREIWWPDAEGEHRMRGHHIQEIIDVFHNRGLALCPIQLFPTLAPSYDADRKAIFDEDFAETRFLQYINNRKGIIITETSRGNRHACAWDGHKVYDPKGYVYDITDLPILECWLVCQWEI